MSGNKANYSSEVALDVFHTARLKSDFSNLKSFLKNGAYSNLAHGYGQGEGFYVWTTLDRAVYHSKFLKSIPNSPKSSYVIFKFQEIIDAENWDLDYEELALLVLSFISGHWGLFKKISDNFLSFIDKGKKHFILPSLSERVNLFNEIFYLRLFYLKEGEKEPKKEDLKTGKLGIGNIRDTFTGALVGTIFNYLQKVYPKKTAKFEINVFKKLVKKGTAIKYVGKDPLLVKSFNLIERVSDGDLAPV